MTETLCHPSISAPGKRLFSGLTLVLSLVLFFSVIEQSQAVMCRDDNGGTTTLAQVQNFVGVANDTPKGAILWRSPPITTTVKCWADFPTSGEYIYFYLNPEYPNNNGLGPDVEMGINFNGQDLICSNLTDKGPAGHCRIRTPIFVNSCGSNAGCAAETKMLLTYSILLVKKSPPTANTDKDLVNFDSYVAARFDGMSGLNMSPTFSIRVSGLKNVKYIPCPATITFSKNTIRFNTVYASNAKPNALADAKDFLLIARRTCDSVFSMNTLMRAAPGSTIDASQNWLIPSLANAQGSTLRNTSVAIELKKDGVRLPFNKEHPIFTKRKETYIEQKIEANLIWLTDKPQVGTFNGGVVMEFFHR